MEGSDGSERMEANDNTIKLIQLAIEQLVAQKKDDSKNRKADEDDDEVLLSKLLLQLESMKKEREPTICEGVAETGEPSPPPNNAETEARNEEILKEIREVKRQNSITHWLLSGMIVLIAAWQFSEVSLLLRVKNRVTHPFKTVGSMVTGAQAALKHFDASMPDVVAPQKKHHSDEASHPALRVPELPYMDMPVLGTCDDN